MQYIIILTYIISINEHIPRHQRPHAMEGESEENQRQSEDKEKCYQYIKGGLLNKEFGNRTKLKKKNEFLILAVASCTKNRVRPRLFMWNLCTLLNIF